MDKAKAIAAFAALSQPTRLDVFRLLIKAGDDGLLAGQISDTLNTRQNTMSANLTILVQAGLIRNRREGRMIHYYADHAGLRGLLSFLLEDCCGGNPDLCKPILDELACC